MFDSWHGHFFFFLQLYPTDFTFWGCHYFSYILSSGCPISQTKRGLHFEAYEDIRSTQTQRIDPQATDQLHSHTGPRQDRAV